MISTFPIGIPTIISGLSDKPVDFVVYVPGFVIGEYLDKQRRKMMKRFGRVFALLLSISLCMTANVPAFAADEKVIKPVNPDDIVEYSEVLTEMPPVILGPADTAEYDNSPNIQTRASGLLFSMTANGVTGLLVTGTAKSFTASDLDNGYLHITGDLQHTRGEGATIKIGGCWYNANTGLYVADLYKYVYEGSVSCSIDTFGAIAKDQVHRGFIKNQAGVGSVSGNLSFYSEE